MKPVDIGYDRVALVLLAAGKGERFGGAKLAALLEGRPLVHHAAATFSALPFACRIAVVACDDFGLGEMGFDLVRVSGSAQSESLAAGVELARRSGPGAILIALGDMPFVTAQHIDQLLAAFDGNCIASSNGKAVMPPALFGPSHFERLSSLSGDRGAQHLLGTARTIRASGPVLKDIDTTDQLAEAAAMAPHQGDMGPMKSGSSR